MMALERNSVFRGELLRNEPMARYTSWRAGGDARVMYKPADRADLLAFIQSLPAYENIVFIGLGSNLLVRDGGIDGTVINLQGALSAVVIEQQTDQSVLVYAESGVSCAQLARFAANNGLTESEFFAGIPGTVGGALAMNAGAFGSETWNLVARVETVNRRGVVTIRQPSEYTVSYRSVRGPEDEWFVAACFRLQRDAANAGKERIRELLNKRGASQPIGVYSCGSVFRNPPGDYAARLIEVSGLKGYRIGGAHVSEKHANFIINDANASAADIENLIIYVQAQVELEQGIRLQPEVHIIGEFL